MRLFTVLPLAICALISVDGLALVPPSYNMIDAGFAVAIDAGFEGALGIFPKMEKVWPELMVRSTHNNIF
jgi:hypothetical protein